MSLSASQRDAVLSWVSSYTEFRDFLDDVRAL